MKRSLEEPAPTKVEVLEHRINKLKSQLATAEVDLAEARKAESIGRPLKVSRAHTIENGVSKGYTYF